MREPIPSHSLRLISIKCLCNECMYVRITIKVEYDRFSWFRSVNHLSLKGQSM